MELESVEKYIHMTKLAQGVEVMFGGQPCLKITEGSDSYIWAIYPVFAKLTYGANLFEDVPYCNENFDTMEEAIADGLAKLHSLGAFVGEVDLPGDTYVEEHLDESLSLDESVAKFKSKVNQAFNSSASGKHKNAKMHLDNARSYLHTVNSTDMSKIKDSYDTYKTLRKKYSELSEETLEDFQSELMESILQDCRAYATKHSTSLMEAHDLSQGLFDSIMEQDYSGVKADAKRQGKTHEQMAADHRKYAASMRNLGKTGLAARSEMLAKEHDKLVECTEELSEGAIKDIENKLANHAATKISNEKEFGKYSAADLHQHEIIRNQLLQKKKAAQNSYNKKINNESTEETLAEAIDKEHPIVKEYSALKKEHDIKSLRSLTGNQSRVKDTSEFKSKDHAISHYLRAKHGNKKFAAAFGLNEDATLDEATKAMSGDTYWKAKEDEAKESKAKADRASAGIKEPEKKGRGKPTLGATVDEMKDRMRENIAAGKRPHTGFDRNEKLRILRSGAMEHPEFAGTHVKAAGRPHGTTKAAAIEKKKSEPTAFSMWAGLGKK